MAAGIGWVRFFERNIWAGFPKMRLQIPVRDLGCVHHWSPAIFRRFGSKESTRPAKTSQPITSPFVLFLLIHLFSVEGFSCAALNGNWDRLE